jgi:general secretion pathway protein A
VPAPWLKWVTTGAIAAAVALVGFGAWSYLGHRSSQRVAATAAAPVKTEESVAPGDATNAAAMAPTAAAVPAATAAPATEDMVPLDQLLVRHGNDTTTEAALGKLFDMWGARYVPTAGRGCDQATKQGLECLFQKGSWAQLRTLNRPAILTLTDDVGRTHQVVLFALSDEQATIDLGGQARDVSIASLSRYWFGDFLLLWRPPMAVVKALTPGMRGADVRWLRDSLRAAQGLPTAPAAAGDVYDDDLVRLVQDFQREHRLNIDGVAGVQTQIVLDTVLNATGSPTIVAQVAGG